MAKGAHPIRLMFLVRNLINNAMIQAALGFEERFLFIVKPVRIAFFDTNETFMISLRSHS